jgi:2-phosphosulfolactate phosphatase
LAAQHLYSLAKEDMVKFLSNSSHVKRLARLGIEKDIAYCMSVDQYQIVPCMIQGVLKA